MQLHVYFENGCSASDTSAFLEISDDAEVAQGIVLPGGYSSRYRIASLPAVAAGTAIRFVFSKSKWYALDADAGSLPEYALAKARGSFVATETGVYVVSLDDVLDSPRVGSTGAYHTIMVTVGNRQCENVDYVEFLNGAGFWSESVLGVFG